MGFWTTTKSGHTVHINGNIEMPEATLLALCEMLDLAVKQATRKMKYCQCEVQSWENGNYLCYVCDLPQETKNDDTV